MFRQGPDFHFEISVTGWKTVYPNCYGLIPLYTVGAGMIFVQISGFVKEESLAIILG